MNVPAISTPLLIFFRRIARGYFRRHFHAVRIAHGERFENITGPLIVYANHSSWWDPMVSILLAWKLMPKRKHYAPMDATSLDRYAMLKRIGIFPIEVASSRGAVQFLRTSEAILASGGVLWVTPQGRFADPRERPLVFKSGMAALAERVASNAGSCTLLALAIEYPFWDECMPETLLHFAEPMTIFAGERAESIQQRSILALDEALEELKGKALARDPESFETLLQGRRGTGGFYALGRRARSFIMRRPYVPEHTPAREMLK